MDVAIVIQLSSRTILLCCLALHRQLYVAYNFKGGITMQKTYSRGDMYYANLGKGVGSEQEGYRPVVIIQNNVGNRFSPMVIIAAISSKAVREDVLQTV